MYYVLLFSQSVLKLYLYSAAKKYKKSDDRVSLTRMKYFSDNKYALRSDRVTGNTLEQMVPFLVSLWLHAWLVDSLEAEWCGWMYILLRVMYAIVFWSKGYSMHILLVTTPAYFLIWYMLVGGIWKYGFL